MLSVVMLNVIMLSVLAPKFGLLNETLLNIYFFTFQIGFGAQRFRRAAGEVCQVLGKARVQAGDRVHREGAQHLRGRRQVREGGAES